MWDKLAKMAKVWLSKKSYYFCCPRELNQASERCTVHQSWL